MKELIAYSLDLRKPREIKFQLLNVDDKILEFMMEKKQFRDPFGSGMIVVSPRLLLKSLPEDASTINSVCMYGFGYQDVNRSYVYADLVQHYDPMVMEFGTEELKIQFSRALQKLIAGMLCYMETGIYSGHSPRVLIHYG